MTKLGQYQVSLHSLLAHISSKGIFSEEGQNQIGIFEAEYNRIISDFNSTVVLPLKGLPEQEDLYNEINRYMDDAGKVVKVFCRQYALNSTNEIQFAKDYGRLIAAVYGLCRLFCSKETRLKKIGVLKVA